MSKTTQSWLSRIGSTVLVILFIILIGLLTYRYYRNLWTLGWSGVWSQTRKLAWHFFLMVCLLVSSVALVALLVGIQTLFSRWRPIKVFISYQHANKALVDELTIALDSPLLRVDFVPFEPTDHDEVIESVGNKIRDADTVVVLPGLEQSFVDAEILAAYALRRPILFLHHDQKQTTPNTALRGYPVFKLSELRRSEFRPLARFIAHIAGSWRDKMRNFSRVSAGFGRRLAIVVFFYIVGAGLVINLISDMLGVISIRWAYSFGLFFCWVVTVVVLLLFNYSYVATVVARFRAIRVARQTISTGNLSFEILSSGLDHTKGDRLILECLEKEPLMLKH